MKKIALFWGLVCACLIGTKTSRAEIFPAATGDSLRCFFYCLDSLGRQIPCDSAWFTVYRMATGAAPTRIDSGSIVAATHFNQNTTCGLAARAIRFLDRDTSYAVTEVGQSTVGLYRIQVKAWGGTMGSGVKLTTPNQQWYLVGPAVTSTFLAAADPQANTIAAADIATDAIGADEIATAGAQEIASNVADSNAQFAHDPDNLVHDPGFEGTSTLGRNWSQVAATVSIVTNSSIKSGRRAARLAGGSASEITSDSFRVTTGQRVLLGADILSGQTLNEYGLKGAATVTFNPLGGGLWYKYQQYWKATATGTYRFYALSNGGANDTLRLDNVFVKVVPDSLTPASYADADSIRDSLHQAQINIFAVRDTTHLARVDILKGIDSTHAVHVETDALNGASLANLDATISSRMAKTDSSVIRGNIVSQKIDVNGTGGASIDWGAIDNPTATVGLSGTQVHVYDTDTSGYTTAVGPVTLANNVTHGGGNAILQLDRMSITSSSGAGLTIAGNGTGAGIDITGGATNAPGILAKGTGTGGVGMVLRGGTTSGSAESLAVTAGNGITFPQAGTNSVGFKGALDTVRNALGVSGTTDTTAVKTMMLNNRFARHRSAPGSNLDTVNALVAGTVGAGAYLCSLLVVDSAAGTPVQGVIVWVTTSGALTTDDVPTNSAGNVVFNLDNGTHAAHIFQVMTRLATNSDTVINIAGANFKDTISVVTGTIAPPSTAGLTRVYGNIRDIGQDSNIVGIEVTATATKSNLRCCDSDTTNFWMAAKYTKQAQWATSGCWYIDLVPSASWNPDASYRFIINVPGVGKFEKVVDVPVSPSVWRLQWAW